MLERLIVEHGSPTLAGLKVGSLIQVPLTDSFPRDFRRVSETLRKKGLAIRVLRRISGKASVYVYRPAKLREVLGCPAVQAFLTTREYEDFDTEKAIRTLSRHMHREAFPHEVGIFLGYPLEDVKAFIHGGRACVACGCWKAYSNECEARRIFALYDKCTAVYTRLYASGSPLEKLTVAVS